MYWKWGLCTWWRHQMETFSALLALCEGNSPVTGEFSSQRPVTRSFDVSISRRHIEHIIYEKSVPIKCLNFHSVSFAPVSMSRHSVKVDVGFTRSPTMPAKIYRRIVWFITTWDAAQVRIYKSPASRLFTQRFISGADQRKHQRCASLAFVWGIHRWPVNSPHKWPVTRKMFPWDDVLMRDTIKTASHRRLWCISLRVSCLLSWPPLLTRLDCHPSMDMKLHPL